MTNNLIITLRNDGQMEQTTRHGILYRITIKGTVNPSIFDWFGDIMIIPKKNSDSVLVVKFMDQSALRGFLDQLWNLNLTILSVERVEKREVVD